ncbi:MAG: hypothetical protein QXF14_01375, partial [Candidatus Woesearchaeota archaeon]
MLFNISGNTHHHDDWVDNPTCQRIAQRDGKRRNERACRCRIARRFIDTPHKITRGDDDHHEPIHPPIVFDRRNLDELLIVVQVNHELFLFLDFIETAVARQDLFT